MLALQGYDTEPYKVNTHWLLMLTHPPIEYYINSMLTMCSSPVGSRSPVACCHSVLPVVYWGHRLLNPAAHSGPGHYGPEPEDP